MGKTADEMFEELGYKIVESNKYIRYQKMNNYYIDFDLKNRSTRVSSFTRPHRYAIYFNMQELQAINKKVQELGWRKLV